MATVQSTEQLFTEKEKRLRAEIEKKHGKTPEQLYEEREKRVRDAIQLKEPDRVPVVLRGNNADYFAAKYTRVPLATAYYDAVAWKEAFKRMVLDFEPDAFSPGTSYSSSGSVLEALDAKAVLWPGGNLPPNASNQFIEAEYMKEDEYDIFLNDPSDFMLRYYLPRMYGVLAPLSKLPPLRTLTGTGFAGIVGLFARPEFQQFAANLYKAGQKQAKWREAMGNVTEEMASLGFPSANHPGGAGGSPFETISSQLRGIRGAMADMYRRPEKLLAACEMILQWNIERATPADPKKRGNPKIVAGVGILKGSDVFMSRKQFETFCWPFMKKAAQASIDLGFVVSGFAEAKCNNRLDYFLELPKGKLLVYFEQTDMARAKAVLGDHACIAGNVPAALLDIGSPQEIEEYCKNLIKACAKDGGFILSHGSTMQNAKIENVKAMMDSVKKYGRY